MSDLRAGRLSSIDALRGIAALMVVLHHALGYPDRETPLQTLADRLLPGHLGVVLFFVISGFCIHLRWARALESAQAVGVEWRAFWKRRVRRLYPPYLVALVLSMVVVVVGLLRGVNAPSLQVYAEGGFGSVALDFFLHATMLHGFHPVFDRAGGNPPLWTLAREEHFYLLYAVLLFWRRRWGLWITVAIPLALSIWAGLLAYLVTNAEGELYITLATSAPALWIQWVLGMVAVEAYSGRIRLPAWCYAWSMAAVWAGLARLCPVLDIRSLETVLWGLAFFTVVNAATRADVRGRWGGRIAGWLSRIGVMSYSLYLVHYPVRAVIKRALGAAAEPDPIAYVTTVVVIMVGSCVAAWIFFLLVERHFLVPRGRPVPVDDRRAAIVTH